MRSPTVLTPHAGELGRLLGVEPDAIGRERLARAREAAAHSSAIVVLKGDDTLVASPAGRVAISPGGAPGLATAGTGDVLAGVLGAMLAKRWTRSTPPAPPFTSTCTPGGWPPSRTGPTRSSPPT